MDVMFRVASRRDLVNKSGRVRVDERDAFFMRFALPIAIWSLRTPF